MVDCVTTPSSDDTFIVELEGKSTGIDTDRDWTKLESLSQLDWVMSLHFLEVREFHISWQSL